MMPTGDNPSMSDLEVEVEAELDLMRSGRPEDEIGQNPAEWLYDPVEAQREEVGLRSILGAVIAMESGPPLAGPGPAAGDPLLD